MGQYDLLIATLVVAIVGLGLSVFALIYTVYRTRQRSAAGKQGELAGSYSAHGHHSKGHDHHRKGRDHHVSWYYNYETDEYEWGHLLLAGFCCILFTLGVGALIFWLATHAFAYPQRHGPL